MSASGIAMERKDELSRQLEAHGYQKLQALIKSQFKESPKFHGHFVLTFTAYDGVVTSHKVGCEETTKPK